MVEVGVRIDQEVGQSYTRRSRPAAAHEVGRDDLVGASLADGRRVWPWTGKQIQVCPFKSVNEQTFKKKGSFQTNLRLRGLQQTPLQPSMLARSHA